VMAQEFIRQLTELKSVVLQRLLTTPLEVLQRKEFLEDIHTNTVKINTAIDNMQNDLSELTLDAEHKVSHNLTSSLLGSRSQFLCSPFCVLTVQRLNFSCWVLKVHSTQNQP